MVHEREHRFDVAADGFRRALRLAPDSIAVKVRLAEVEVSRSEIPPARKLLRDVLETDPECLRALTALGRLESDEGAHDAALDLLWRAVEVSPDSNNVRFYLATALKRAGREDEAQAHLGFGGPRESD